MNSVLKSLLIATMGVLCSSCFLFHSDETGDVDYYPVQIEEDGKWGMIGPDGKMLFSDEFKNAPSCVIEGMFSVQEGETYSLYEAGEKPKLVDGCDDLTSVGFFNDGVAPATHKKGRITIINKSGKTLGTLLPIAGKEIVSTSIAITDGRLVFQTEEGLSGATDKDGMVVIEPKFKGISLFNDGYAIALNEIKEEMVYMIIDKKGNEVTRLKKGFRPMNNIVEYEMISVADEDGRWGFVNLKGEFSKAPGKVAGIGEYNKKYYTYRDEDGSWGVMSMEGEIMIRAKYDNITFCGDDKFFAKNDDEYVLLNIEGDKELSLKDYDYATTLTGKFCFLGKDKSTYIFLDKEGKPITKEEFKGVNFAWASSYEVTSDYFNNESVVKTVMSELTKNGFGKYHVGESVAALGLDYSDYVYSYSIYDSELIPNGWRYTASLMISTNSYIASREYSYYGYSYDSRVVANPDCKIASITLNVDAQVEFWKDIKSNLIEQIKQKGYKLVADQEDKVTFNGDNCSLTLVPSSDGSELRVVVSEGTIENFDAPEAVEEVAAAEADTVVVVEDW